MKQPKFTPGPWVACETDDGHEILMGDFLLEAEELEKLGRASHHEIQYEHMCYYDNELDENNPGNIQAREAEANAHLMAAAPDMYEALKRLTKYGDIFRYKNGESNPYEQAISALAKAEVVR